MTETQGIKDPHRPRMNEASWPASTTARRSCSS